MIYFGLALLLVYYFFLLLYSCLKQLIITKIQNICHEKLFFIMKMSPYLMVFQSINLRERTSIVLGLSYTLPYIIEFLALNTCLECNEYSIN